MKQTSFSLLHLFRGKVGHGGIKVYVSRPYTGHKTHLRIDLDSYIMRFSLKVPNFGDLTKVRMWEIDETD